MAEFKEWPAWRHGPNGESQVFEKESDVPKGWTAHRQSQSAAKTDDRDALLARIAELEQEVAELRAGKGVLKLVDANGDGYGSVREIEAALREGKVSVDEIEALELKRAAPRKTVLGMIERERAAGSGSAQEKHADARAAAIETIREAGIEIADDAEDFEIEAALLLTED